MSAPAIFTVTLGCPKNRVDTEVMLGHLVEAGYRPVLAADQADILLINTCGFIQPAVEEAIDEILTLAAVKEKHPNVLFVVTGCLVQRYGEDLIQQFPEVDLFIGTDGFADIVDHIQLLSQQSSHISPTSNFLMDCQQPRILTTPPHRAFLKISEGCSNSCAYCLIPSLRGPLRSRQVDDLVCEAQKLADSGIQELTIIGQDVTAYGIDQGVHAPSLPDLLNALLKDTAIPWLRLLYLYPSRVTDELLQLMAQEPRLLSYLDIPLQHVSESILRAMRRPFGRRHIEDIINRIKAIIPQAAIRTTFMVGFPGETEADVEEIANFMRQHRLNNVGIFTYCNEPGCPAEHLPDQLSAEAKEERYNYLMATQAPISLALNEEMVGSSQEVLVEGVSAETELLLAGRTKYQAADIDGCVYIADGQCQSGELVQVRITEAHPYDLVGEIIPE